MNYIVEKKIPKMEDIIHPSPISIDEFQSVQKHRKEIKSILSCQDKRILLIVGPCSAWPNHAVIEYAEKLAQLEQKVRDKIKIAMRVYVEKPRTTAGWTGVIYQPNPVAGPDVVAGIKYARDMMLKVIKIGLPIASEILFIQHQAAFIDLISWVAIGARSSENQEHRIYASSLDLPVGLKNPTHGSLTTSCCSVVAAQHSHIGVLEGYQVKTYGNPYAHLVLRGSNNATNYSLENIEKVYELMKSRKIQNPSTLIDVSHDNSIVNGVKDFRVQPKVLFDVLQSLASKPELMSFVKGFMLESFLQTGNQIIDLNHPEKLNTQGLSITDPCLGWDETEQLILQAHELLKTRL